MKKLFVAVIMFVIVPSVLAKDPTPVTTPTSPPEGSDPHGGQAQGGQQTPADPLLSVKTPTSKTDTGDGSSGDGKENPAPVGMGLGVAHLALGVSILSAVVTLIGLIQTNKSRKITERAYLSAEQWKIEGDYLVCKVTNKGRTPAILLSGYVEFIVWANPRADKPETRRKVTSKFAVSELPAELPAQVTVPMQAGTLSAVEWKAVKEERTYTLFVEAYIQYRDAFKETRIMRFVMEYDAKIKDFVVAAERTVEKFRNEQPE